MCENPEARKCVRWALHLRCNDDKSMGRDVRQQLRVERVLQGEAVVELHHRILPLLLRQRHYQRLRCQLLRVRRRPRSPLGAAHVHDFYLKWSVPVDASVRTRNRLVHLFRMRHLSEALCELGFQHLCTSSHLFIQLKQNAKMSFMRR